MPISEDLKRIYATAPTAEHYIETLELRHPNFLDGPKFLTNQLAGLVATLEDDVTMVAYQYLPFAVIPPRSEEEGNITLQVAIDNSDKQLMEELERLASAPTDPIEVYYRVYISGNTQLQNNPPLKLDIMGITATKSTLTFSAGLANLRTRPFPTSLYTTTLFPGLYR